MASDPAVLMATFRGGPMDGETHEMRHGYPFAIQVQFTLGNHTCMGTYGAIRRADGGCDYRWDVVR